MSRFVHCLGLVGQRSGTSMFLSPLPATPWSLFLLFCAPHAHSLGARLQATHVRRRHFFSHLAPWDPAAGIIKPAVTSAHRQPVRVPSSITRLLPRYMNGPCSPFFRSMRQLSLPLRSSGPAAGCGAAGGRLLGGWRAAAAARAASSWVSKGIVNWADRHV